MFLYVLTQGLLFLLFILFKNMQVKNMSQVPINTPIAVGVMIIALG